MALPALNGTSAADSRLEATRGDNLLPTSHQNKQRRRGRQHNPGVGLSRPTGRDPQGGLAVFWNDSMLLMFSLRLLPSSCGRNKLLSTGSWRDSLSSTERPHANPAGAGVRAPVRRQFVWFVVTFAGQTYIRPVFRFDTATL